MKLTMLKGLPASGKSTKARDLVNGGGNTIRLNRDLLRKMFHFDKFSGTNEAMIVETEKELAATHLALGRSVVIDDCNLNPKNEEMWRAVATDLGAKFEVISVDTEVQTCVERDSYRTTDKVGPAVILNMALQYGLMPKPRLGYVLCDLDGTLCNIDHRLHFVKGPDEKMKKDWKSFFEGIPNDKLNLDVEAIARKFRDEGYEIIFVSARPENYRAQTEEWLKKNITFPYTTLIMRYANDKRDDVEVKRDILNKYFKDRSKIYRILDDRPRVIRMWKEEGLEVIDCGKGIEF